MHGSASIYCPNCTGHTSATYHVVLLPPYHALVMCHIVRCLKLCIMCCANQDRKSPHYTPTLPWQILEDLKPASVLVIGSYHHLHFISQSRPLVPFLRCAMTSTWKEAPPTKCPPLESPNFIKGEAAACKCH